MRIAFLFSVFSALQIYSQAKAELPADQLKSCAQSAILKIIDGRNWLITNDGFKIETAPTYWDQYRVNVVNSLESLSLPEDQLSDFNIHLITFRTLNSRVANGLILEGSIRMITERVVNLQTNPPNIKVGNNSSVEMVDRTSGRPYRCTLVRTVRMPNRRQADVQGYELNLRLVSPQKKAPTPEPSSASSQKP